MLRVPAVLAVSPRQVGVGRKGGAALVAVPRSVGQAVAAVVAAHVVFAGSAAAVGGGADCTEAVRVRGQGGRADAARPRTAVRGAPVRGAAVQFVLDGEAASAGPAVPPVAVRGAGDGGAALGTGAVGTGGASGGQVAGVLAGRGAIGREGMATEDAGGAVPAAAVVGAHDCRAALGNRCGRDGRRERRSGAGAGRRPAGVGGERPCRAGRCAGSRVRCGGRTALHSRQRRPARASRRRSRSRCAVCRWWRRRPVGVPSG